MSIKSVRNEIKYPLLSPIQLKEKLTAGLWLTLWISLPYYGLQYVAIRPVIILPPGPIDDLIGFNAAAVWPYLSLFLLMPLTGWLIEERIAFRKWAAGLFWISLISNLVFLLWPNGIDREVRPVSLAHRIILFADLARNVFPSLHASLSVYCGIWGYRLLRVRNQRSLQHLFPLWTLFILWSTLALKQHVFVDILSGGLLGILFGWVSLRGWQKD